MNDGGVVKVILVSVSAVIPAEAGMTTRHGVTPKAITVIPAKAGIHDFGQPASR